VSDPYTTGDYARHNPDWHEADAQHKAAAVAALVLGHLVGGPAPVGRASVPAGTVGRASVPAGTVGRASVPALHVADVGCGTGAVLSFLLPVLNASGEGWDIAPEAIRRARQRSHATFHLGDFAAEGGHVDLALLLDVVEHVPDPEGFLRAVGAKADHVVLRLPLEDSAWDRLRPARARAARERYGHLRAWSRRGALDLVRAAGLRVVTETYDRVPPVLSGPGAVTDRVREALVAVSPHRGVALMGGYSWLALLEKSR
jgi:SAM-dependent methyltransferase